MSSKVQKAVDEIARTKAKIKELQALLPQLERKRLELENDEIIKAVRSADISPADLPQFLQSLKDSGGTSGVSQDCDTLDTHLQNDL